jgi:hypothetical protein
MAMKALYTTGLCLALGLTPVRALAQDVTWRPAGAAPPPAPVVSLSRPVPLDAGQPNAVAPASFQNGSLTLPQATFRGKAPDAPENHLLMPVGPAGARTEPGTTKPLFVEAPRRSSQFVPPVPTLLDDGPAAAHSAAAARHRHPRGRRRRRLRRDVLARVRRPLCWTNSPHPAPHRQLLLGGR